MPEEGNKIDWIKQFWNKKANKQNEIKQILEW